MEFWGEMHTYIACGPNPAAILKGLIFIYFESPLACWVNDIIIITIIDGIGKLRECVYIPV